MIFRNDAANSHVPAFLGSWQMLFQQRVTVNLQVRHTCESYIASPEKSLYLLLNKIDLVTDSSRIKI